MQLLKTFPPATVLQVVGNEGNLWYLAGASALQKFLGGSANLGSQMAGVDRGVWVCFLPQEGFGLFYFVFFFYFLPVNEMKRISLAFSRKKTYIVKQWNYSYNCPEQTISTWVLLVRHFQNNNYFGELLYHLQSILSYTWKVKQSPSKHQEICHMRSFFCIVFSCPLTLRFIPT